MARSVTRSAGRPRTGFAFLDDPAVGTVIAMAHRGGAEHPDLVGLENTARAFRHAAGLGYRYLETDVHLTADGVLLAFHDDVLDRVTDHRGPIEDLSLAQVQEALVGGSERVPTLVELLDGLPAARFNIDVKAEAAAAVLADLVLERGLEDRVLVGSFSRSRMALFRRRTRGRVPTSATPWEVACFRLVPSARLARLLTRGRVAALQVPHRRGPLRVVTPALVRRAHRAGAHVHVWTVDDPAEMEQLLDLGVDGLITDRTDLLREVLVRRGAWQEG